MNKPDSGDKVERASKPTDVSGEEYEELRKRLRERKKALQSVPHLILKTVGQVYSQGNFLKICFCKFFPNRLFHGTMGNGFCEEGHQ